MTSFVPQSRRSLADRWVRELPIALILLAQVVLMARMRNAAFQDEALYINAGHDYLQHWTGGPAPGPYGTYFSGAPAFYPVIAAALDQVGGLLLVRLLSAACMLATTWLVFRIGEHLWTRRCGLAAAALYAVNGSVVYLGVLATYDAFCVCALTAATYLAITRTSRRAAVACGGLLFVAVLSKYTGIVFVPMIAGFAGVTDSLWRRGVVRAVTIATIPVVLVTASLETWGRSLIPGIEFTTVGRHALTEMSYRGLIEVVLRDDGLLVLAAIGGAVALLRTVRGAALLALLGAAAVALPFGQIRIHEFTSLDKHLAYSAIFLALLAGRAVMTLSLRSGRVFVALVLIWLIQLDGLWRSDIFFNGWPNETQVVRVLERPHPTGEYLAFEADSFSYYLSGDSSMSWQTAYAVFNQGTKAAVAAVRSGRIAGWVLRTHAFGADAPYGRTQTAVMAALRADPQYRLVAHLKAQRYSPGYWYVWEKVQTA